MPEPLVVMRPSLGRGHRPSRLALAATALRSWGRRQVLVAAVGAVLVTLLIGVATVLIPNDVFSRDIPPVWWDYPVWILTGILCGALIATYVGQSDDAARQRSQRRSGPMGMAGAVLGWFAVGCPVCNKIALLALGYTGALTWFAPFQPVLAVAALVLTGVALVWRLSGQVACPMPLRRPVREVAR